MLVGAGTASAVGVRSSASGDVPQLSVAAFSEQGIGLLALSITPATSAQPAAARVEVDVPRGYVLDLTQAPGSNVGNLFGSVGAAGGQESSITIASGQLTVDDPAKYVVDPVAQACAPGAHTAVWLTSLSVLGQTLPLPVFVDPAPADATTGPAYRLTFCPLWAPSAGSPSGIRLIDGSFFFTALTAAPTDPGTYTWSALVAPTTAAYAPDPAAAYELRATIVIPQAFTLTARYVARTKTVIVTGHLTASGVPRAGVPVALTSRSRGGDLVFLGRLATDGAGTFAVRRRVAQTTTFSASVEDETGPCTAPSAAPAGCASETIPGPDSASATVIVPRPTDPRRAIRARDQALAKRVSISSADFANGWQAVADSPGPCTGFAPNLRRLTLTGQVFSPVFSAAGASAAARSTVTVFATRADASAAFGLEAKPAVAACEAADISSGGTTVMPKPIPFPRLGEGTTAYRAVISDPSGAINVDVITVRVRRVVFEIDVYSAGSAQDGLDLALARNAVARARSQS